jgi:hypothetical protein
VQAVRVATNATGAAAAAAVAAESLVGQPLNLTWLHDALTCRQQQLPLHAAQKKLPEAEWQQQVWLVSVGRMRSGIGDITSAL